MGTIAIAALRTKILASLDDAVQNKFSSNQLDQGVRVALFEYTKARPIEATYSFDADGSNVIIMPTSFLAFHVIDVYKDETYPQFHYPFYAYIRDEQWNIETPSNTIPANTALIAAYSKANGIDGLDSFAGTTIPDDSIEIFAIGAAGFAIMSRITARSEAVNVNNDAEETLSDIGKAYIERFMLSLMQQDRGFVTANWALDTESKF